MPGSVHKIRDRGVGIVGLGVNISAKVVGHGANFSLTVVKIGNLGRFCDLLSPDRESQRSAAEPQNGIFADDCSSKRNLRFRSDSYNVTGLLLAAHTKSPDSCQMSPDFRAKCHQIRDAMRFSSPP